VVVNNKVLGVAELVVLGPNSKQFFLMVIGQVTYAAIVDILHQALAIDIHVPCFVNDPVFGLFVLKSAFIFGLFI